MAAPRSNSKPLLQRRNAGWIVGVILGYDKQHAKAPRIFRVLLSGGWPCGDAGRGGAREQGDKIASPH